MRGFLTPGFALSGQQNLNNDGGVVGTDNTPVVNDLITSFTSPGTFTGASPLNTQGGTGKLVVVGGGGGASQQGGGGGSGGVIVVNSIPLTPGVPVTIGSGGASAGNALGNPGNNTSWNGPVVYTAQGGGGSGRRQPNYTPPGPSYNGQSGGSGGGGGKGSNNPQQNTPGGNGSQPSQPAPGANQNLGNPGGPGTATYGPYDNRVGGGGGGAGQAGGYDPVGGVSPATGGLGIPVFPSKTAQPATDEGWVGGGGRGPGSPGTGGGGIGGYLTPPPGKNGTGGGGGSCYNGGSQGGGGGSGGVHVFEAKAGPRNVSGFWTAKAVYSAVVDDNWTN